MKINPAKKNLINKKLPNFSLEKNNVGSVITETKRIHIEET